jgi:DNA-binding XRE family transcriptional regulator
MKQEFVFNHYRMRAKRKADGITQEELAKELEVNIKTIRKTEKGQSQPSIDLLFRICQWFGDSVEAFVIDTDDHVCHKCGCTDFFACENGCYWVSDNLCSECAKAEEVK